MLSPHHDVACTADPKTGRSQVHYDQRESAVCCCRCSGLRAVSPSMSEGVWAGRGTSSKGEQLARSQRFREQNLSRRGRSYGLRVHQSGARRRRTAQAKLIYRLKSRLNG